MRQITFKPDFESWRAVARQLLREQVPPSEVHMADCDQESTLWTADFVNADSTEEGSVFLVPRRFIDSARHVACHINPLRWQLLYSLLWRLQQDRNLLKVQNDDQVKTFLLMEQQIRRDVQKMQALVSFQRVEADGAEYFIAWHRPDYSVVELASAFFTERFSAMRWSILTPYRSVHWKPESKRLEFGKGVPRFTPPQKEDLKELWRTYCAAAFDPAVVKPKPVRKEPFPSLMLSEAASPELHGMASPKGETMLQPRRAQGAAVFIPNSPELPVLREAVQRCQGCELHRDATQAVFGVGPADARIMLVGEQPGNDEDIAGTPFVGPAGKLLDRALAEAGIDRESIYITNAVKHFKFERRGSRRIHRTPQIEEIRACKPWVEREIKTIKPEIIVCLGATAAKSLLDLQNLLMKHRGQIFSSPYAEKVIATIHPSAILRMKDPITSEQLFQTLCRDLKLARETLANSAELNRAAS